MECVNCPTGYYQDQDMQIDCKHCLHGTHQDQTKQTGCKDCATGKFSNAIAQVHCTLCAIGRYQDQTKRTSCKNCWETGKTTQGLGSVYCDSCKSGYGTKSRCSRNYQWCECEFCNPMDDNEFLRLAMYNTDTREYNEASSTVDGGYCAKFNCPVGHGYTPAFIDTENYEVTTDYQDYNEFDEDNWVNTNATGFCALCAEYTFSNNSDHGQCQQKKQMLYRRE